MLDFEIYQILYMVNFLFEADLIWRTDTNWEGRRLKVDPELMWSGVVCAVEMQRRTRVEANCSAVSVVALCGCLTVQTPFFGNGGKNNTDCWAFGTV